MRLLKSYIYKVGLIVLLYFGTYYYWYGTELVALVTSNSLREKRFVKATELPKPETPQPTTTLTAWSPDHANVPITRRQFTASEKWRVFILGAVAKNSTPESEWDRYALYGQWYDLESLNLSSLRCCYKSKDGRILERGVYDYNVRDYPPSLFAGVKLYLWHVTCRSPGFVPDLISVSRKTSCSNRAVGYVRPYFAMRQPADHLVLTTKIAYAHVDADYVINFLETVKYLGVDKVIVYVYETLDNNVKIILKYYAHIGLVYYYMIELADTEHLPRIFPPLSNQYRHDEWIVMRDALERSMGSSYFGIFDMDEFLIPYGNHSLKTLLTELSKRYQDASHFFFKNIHYFTDETTPNCGPLCPLFKRHIMASPQRFNNIHEKMILIPSKVDTSTICNHYVKPLLGFSRATCPESMGFVRHYGSCARKFNQKLCARKTHWLQDTSMLALLDKHLGATIIKSLEYLKDYIQR